MSTVQLKLNGEIYYNSTCKYCGKPFNKTHNRQMYCSPYCCKQAVREQKARYQRKRRKLVRDGVLIVTDREKGCNTYNSNFLSEHRHKNFDRERRAVEREMKRLGLR
jgi:hypothetical protein